MNDILKLWKVFTRNLNIGLQKISGLISPVTDFIHKALEYLSRKCKHWCVMYTAYNALLTTHNFCFIIEE